MSNRSGLQLPLDPEVADLISKGFTDRQIADELGCSYNRIRWHVQQAHSKMGTRKRTHLVMKYYSDPVKTDSSEQVS